MNLPPNLFRRGLESGRQMIGLWNSIPGPVPAEAVATCGFDWVVIDTEHAVTDVPQVLPMLQAMAPYPVAPVVRPAANDPVLIKRLLDLGAQTLLVPYVETAGQAAAAVSAMRYAPAGIRGMAGVTRANRFGAVAGYAARAEQELCLIVQAETLGTLDRIEEICAVDGVDAVFIGPADLAATMGLPGQATHPEVRAVVEQFVRRITAAGKPAGILTFDQDFARDCIGWGTRFTAVGMDLALMVQAARGLAAAFRS
ncbi:MAG: HpcH/HpaI aldolase/citrate lyase family protein [Paracoccaceae bacterium]